MTISRNPSYPPSGPPSYTSDTIPVYRGGASGGGSAPISCAYPLDDDGTLAGAFGFGHAGPAVGDGQQMQYARTGSATGGTALLMPANALGSASFDLPSSGYALIEAVANDSGSYPLGVAILWHNGGTLTDFFGNALTSTSSDVIAIRVDSDGTVRWYLNDVEQAATGKTIPSGQKFAFYLFALDDGGASLPSTADMTLRTQAGDFTGSYPAGGADPCGNAI